MGGHVGDCLDARYRRQCADDVLVAVDKYDVGLQGLVAMPLPVGQQQALPLDVLHARHEAEGTARQVIVRQSPYQLLVGSIFLDARILVGVRYGDDGVAVRQPDD